MCAKYMVRPNRDEEFVGIKVYYRDRNGVMKAIPHTRLIIPTGSPGVIVYTNIRSQGQKIEMLEVL